MESLIESLTCTLDMNGTNGGVGISAGAFLTGKHFLDNPKYLPCCRRKACNSCVLKHLSKRRHSAATQPEMLFNCPWCSKNTRVSVMSSPNGYQEVNLDSDEFARAEYERNLNEINHYLIKKLENGIRNIEDRLHNKEKYLNKRRDYIENEIHAQVEALKAHLDTLEAEMKDSLEQSTQNMVLMLDKFEKQNESRLEDMKITIENLKSNAMLMNGVTINGSIGGAENGGVLTTSKKQQLNPKLNLALQNQSVNSCVEHLSELTKISKSISEMINELKFDPHVDLPSASSLIGDLKCVHDINLKELFKTVKTHTQISRMCSLPGSNQLMPISPRYMCIGDPYTLFFTDSQTKQLVQVKLDSGELVRASNLGGQLKNPDGVCVNPIAGCIYVSDSELKIIFKIDYQFNILKKFGFRDLKWPRGIFYDYESSYPANGINPNRLYVCDPSSQFIAIYNDHEQLRDCLTISMSDEPLPSYAKANEMLDIKGNMTPSINVNGTSGGQATIEEELKFCPLNVFVNKTHIYVTDDWTGGNCIRIFDKLTHRLLRNVGDLNAWNPLGLVIDDSGNIFTVARLYYETGSTHLFCFNKEGDLVYKTNLSISNEYVTDIVLDKYTSRLNNRIVCSGDKKIHFFQF